VRNRCPSVNDDIAATPIACLVDDLDGMFMVAQFNERLGFEHLRKRIGAALVDLVQVSR